MTFVMITSSVTLKEAAHSKLPSLECALSKCHIRKYETNCILMYWDLMSLIIIGS